MGRAKEKVHDLFGSRGTDESWATRTRPGAAGVSAPCNAASRFDLTQHT
eukprot:CAMPEP_0119412984 /NCGR_PEP_ID=MMETSP1335-20130426/5228_1 /TAXON_ID=259385 /ORGANISM="Chrysoculter rhomboideus, Strain RCC1486" /LENGTH=48 /DNA_ID= /DNA_START= /DNA_END= /DNA_ORIENTATION=